VHYYLRFKQYITKMKAIVLLILVAVASAFRMDTAINMVDTNGTEYSFRPRNFKGISIYGLETNLRNTVCSWKHPSSYYIEKLHELGFNSLRVPLSIQYLVEGNYDILDSIVAKAGELDMQVYLDIHRVSNAYQQPDPDKGIVEFDQVSDRDEFMNFVITMLARYFHNPTVVAILSWNEYTGTDINYKRGWDRNFFDVVEQSFPGRFLLVATGLLWGGLLVGYSLEDLPYSDRILYSAHKYHFSPPANPQGWDSSFGNVWPPEKIVVGEWGFRDSEDLWFGRDFAKYLKEKGIKNQFFWTIAHSGDTGGLWLDDCETINWTKYDIIKPLLED
jgi:aryl-phospho-beta-D-glucosidase BglC (GH1 family)